jgi:hypothetical protein
MDIIGKHNSNVDFTLLLYITNHPMWWIFHCMHIKFVRRKNSRELHNEKCHPKGILEEQMRYNIKNLQESNDILWNSTNEVAVE